MISSYLNQIVLNQYAKVESSNTIYVSKRKIMPNSVRYKWKNLDKPQNKFSPNYWPNIISTLCYILFQRIFFSIILQPYIYKEQENTYKILTNILYKFTTINSIHRVQGQHILNGITHLHQGHWVISTERH